MEGLRPVGSGPENMVSFRTNYAFTETKLKGLGIGLSLNYSGESYAFNQKPDGALILPAYTIPGSHITYDTKRYRFGMKVNNLTDEKYILIHIPFASYYERSCAFQSQLLFCFR